MSKSDLAKLAAEALARGMPVTRIAMGASNEISERDWQRAVRAPRNEQALIDERHEVVDHRGVSHFRNGLGEWLS